MGFWTKRESRRPIRPGIEALEGRVVLTTYHALDVDQLQADVAAVSHSTAANTIVLAPGIYELPGTLQIQNASNLTIRGGQLNKGSVTLMGGIGNRVLEIDNSNVTLSDMSITSGGSVTEGGGIDSQNSNLTIKDSSVSGNSAQVMGGGIFAQGGSLSLVNSSVNNNAASTGPSAFGGGIAAVNTAVSLKSSTVNNNSVHAIDLSPQGAVSAQGAGIYLQGGTLSLTGTALSSNVSTAVSGGAFNSNLGAGVSTVNTVVTASRVEMASNALNTIGSQNVLSQGSIFATQGGSLTISDSEFSLDTPAGGNEFYHPNTTVTIQDSTFDGKKFSGSFILGAKGIKPLD